MTKLGSGITYPIDCNADGPEINFDMVAKTEDVDLLRDAVLEILDVVRATNDPRVTKIIGPACDKLLEKRSEATG